MNPKAYDQAIKKKLQLYHDPGADWEECTEDPDHDGNIRCKEPDHFELKPFRYMSKFGWVNS